MSDKNLQEKFTKTVESKQDKNRENKADVFIEHDLAIGIMNLIAIEEHLFFTGAKTQKTEYYDMINDIREMRKELLKKIIKEYEGEIWCTSKHLLTASMRMMEVGTKEQTLGNNEEAYKFFDKSYHLYMMFWVLNSNQQDNSSAYKITTSMKDEAFIKRVKEISEEIKETFFEKNESGNSLEKENHETDNTQNIQSKQIESSESKFSLKNIKKFISEKLDCCRE